MRPFRTIVLALILPAVMIGAEPAGLSLHNLLALGEQSPSLMESRGADRGRLDRADHAARLERARGRRARGDL